MDPPFPLPRLPQALARYQEAIPICLTRIEPLPQILKFVIPLREMCCKWWLEKVQHLLPKGIPRSKVFALNRYLSDLPRELRAQIIQNGLRAGGLHLAHGSKEIPAVNKSLVFVTPDLPIHGTVYLSLPQQGCDAAEGPIEVELLLQNGDLLSRIVLSLPPLFSDSIRRVVTNLCRVSRQLTHITMINATDDALTLVTRHCQRLVHIDVHGSVGVTDEGINRVIVNLRWGISEGTNLNYFDVDSTNVSVEGLVAIITRLPGLKSLGHIDPIEALEVSDALQQGDLVTNLQAITLKCVTINRLKSLRKYCPNIEELRAIFQEHPGATLNDLKLLKGLTKLDITVREPFLLSPANVYDFAWDIGSCLSVLRVQGDIYFEADLGLLAAHCPNLQKIYLPAVTFPTKESIQALQAKNTPTLLKLEELEIDCMQGVGPKAWAKDFTLSRRGIVLVLSRSFGLIRLVMRPTNLVDNDLLDILACNRMSKLEVLELYNTTLGLASAQLVVETCVHLHVMKGLRTWRGLSLQELVLIRQFSRGHRRAADLKILP